MDGIDRSLINDLGRLALRICVGGLMAFHGVSKVVHGVAWLPPVLNQHGLPGFIAYGIYLAEVVAPVLIILGWQTRAAALVIAFDMIMAVWLAHSNDIFGVHPGGGWGIEIEAFYFLAAVALAFLGAGRFSISRGSGKMD